MFVYNHRVLNPEGLQSSHERLQETISYNPSKEALIILTTRLFISRRGLTMHGKGAKLGLMMVRLHGGDAKRAMTPYQQKDRQTLSNQLSMQI